VNGSTSSRNLRSTFRKSNRTGGVTRLWPARLLVIALLSRQYGLTSFSKLILTKSVLDAQAGYFGRSRPVTATGEGDALGDEEIRFNSERGRFYMAIVTENRWPYLQHRGGKPGFFRVHDSHTLAFADYKGNRQLISTGNLAVNDRVALFLMDYPNRTRLKIIGHGRVVDARERPELFAIHHAALYRGRIRRDYRRHPSNGSLNLRRNCLSPLTFTDNSVCLESRVVRSKNSLIASYPASPRRMLINRRAKSSRLR
jgi:Pyridoxamine 5'-phosphate oxidase